MRLAYFSLPALAAEVRLRALDAFSAASSGVRQAIRIKAHLQIAERLDFEFDFGWRSGLPLR
jgi:hypothetical protein